jgi:hypothetical protein
VALKELGRISRVPIKACATGKSIEDALGHPLCIYAVNTVCKGICTGIAPILIPPSLRN